MKILGTDFGLKGIVPPLVTPLTKDMELDVKGFEKLIEHVISGGVHGIFVLGTTGELSRLGFDVRERVIEQACRIVNSRIPVLVGITDTSMQETLRLEKIASKHKADGVVVAPPCYYHVEQDELLSYFEELASSISLPLYLYNMPARTKIDITLDTVIKASKIDGVIGFKDSSGDFSFLQKVLLKLKDQPKFDVLVGPEEIMASSVLVGAEGGVSGGANLFPELFVELYNASVIGDMKVVHELQDVVTQISSTLYQIGRDRANFIKILKEALHQKGICQPHMAKPYIPMTAEDKLEVAKCLNSIHIPKAAKDIAV